MDRRELERLVAIKMELRRRRNLEMTRYGIVNMQREVIRVIQDDGSGNFVEVRGTPSILVPEALEKVVSSKHRFVVMYGGRGGGKSHTVAEILLAKAKDYGVKTLCCREFQASIRDSSHASLKDAIGRVGLDEFNTTNDTISYKGEPVFRFSGIARNPDSVKSASGFSMAMVEEAHAISDNSLKLLTPTIRAEGSSIWFLLNPSSSDAPVAKRFIKPFQAHLDTSGYYEDDMHLVIKLNYDSNPWFPDSLEQERAYDETNLPDEVYRHIWLGDYNDSVDNSLIKPEWFNACIDAHEKLGIEPSGKKVASFDPSDEGGDAKGFCFMHGNMLKHIDQKLDGDAAQGVDWASGKARQYGAQAFVWDCDGLGVSLKREVERSMPRVEHVMFKGSSGVDNPNQSYGEGSLRSTNKDSFKNKRAQYYVMLRDRIYSTYLAVTRGDSFDQDAMISISSDCGNIDALRSELCRIPTKNNETGKIQLMSKPDMARMGIKSPNMADALMMALAGMKEKPKSKPLEFVSLC